MEWPVLDSSQTKARSLIHIGVYPVFLSRAWSRISRILALVWFDRLFRMILVLGYPSPNSSGVRRSSRVSRLQDQSQIFYETTAAGSVSELAVLVFPVNQSSFACIRSS